jgi:hypothetical protein
MSSAFYFFPQDQEPDYANMHEYVYCNDIDRYIYNPEMSEGFTYIYFIYLRISPKHKDLEKVKIGVARDPEHRLKCLQTGCPFRLEIVYIFKVPIGMESDLEKTLHKKFGKCHIRGEWFTSSWMIANWIAFHKSQVDKKYNKVERSKLRKQNNSKLFRNRIAYLDEKMSKMNINSLRYKEALKEKNELVNSLQTSV